MTQDTSVTDAVASYARAAQTDRIVKLTPVLGNDSSSLGLRIYL